MKKTIVLLLTIALCLTFFACGGESGSDPAKEENSVLTLGTVNSIPDYVDFTLFKVYSAKKVTASVGDGLYFENSNSGETYVDIVLDLTNKKADTINSEDVLVATATNATGTEYRTYFYAVETNNATYLTEYENIASLSTVRFHCIISVPETETALTLKLKVDGKEFTYDYTLGKTDSNAKSINVGDTVEGADFATLVFNGIEYKDDLLPTNTSGGYSHYEIENSANTYLVVKFDLTNYMSTEKDCENFVGIKAMYMDKYTYTGYVVVEDEDGKGFSSYEKIAPLSTRHFYYLIEVPKTVAENEVKLTLSFNGQEYIYAGK